MPPIDYDGTRVVLDGLADDLWSGTGGTRHAEAGREMQVRGEELQGRKGYELRECRRRCEAGEYRGSERPQAFRDASVVGRNRRERPSLWSVGPVSKELGLGSQEGEFTMPPCSKTSRVGESNGALPVGSNESVEEGLRNSGGSEISHWAMSIDLVPPNSILGCKPSQSNPSSQPKTPGPTLQKPRLPRCVSSRGTPHRLELGCEPRQPNTPSDGAYPRHRRCHSPVLPYPPPPRSLGGNSATSTSATLSTR